MKLLPLNCNNCGAPLEAPAGAKYLTCGFCATRLSIVQAGGSYSTEVLEAIDTRTQRIAEDVTALRRAEELAQLDREWEACRASYMTGNADGPMTVPSRSVAVFFAVALCIAGVAFTIMVSSVDAPPPIKFIGVIPIVIGIGGGLMLYVKANMYHEEHAKYMRLRRALMSRQ